MGSAHVSGTYASGTVIVLAEPRGNVAEFAPAERLRLSGPR